MEVFEYTEKLIRTKFRKEAMNLLRISNLTEMLKFHTQEFFSSMIYLEPLRIIPERFYISSGRTFTNIGRRGEHLVEILDMLDEEKKKNLDKWLVNLDLATKINLETVARGKSIKQITTTDPNTRFKINLADSAFGFSQIIPFIVEGINCERESLIIAEQPEIHLNPKIQSKLGDFLIHLYTKRSVKTLIETHSEHLVLRLQRRIAEGDISADNIAIYFFEQDKDGTSVKELNIDENGHFIEWPEGFFEDDLADAYKIGLANTKKRKRE